MEIIENILKEARVLNENLKFKEVIELITSKILSETKNSELFVEKAKAYNGILDKKQALLYFEAAIQFDIKNANAHYYIGDFYFTQNEPEKAKKYFLKYIKLKSNEKYGYIAIGNVFKRIKQYQKAIINYKKALEIDSLDVYTHNFLGLCYVETKDFNHAINEFNKALKLDISDYTAHIGLGDCFFSKKDYAKAIKNYNKAIELFESSNKGNPAEISRTRNKLSEISKLKETSEYFEFRNVIDGIKELLLFEDNYLTHYTSLTAATNLIMKESLFRLTEGSFINDTSEGTELLKFLDIHSPFDTGNDTISTPFISKPFILSFVPESKHNDLTLWRMYGKEDKEEAKGCSITFDRNKFRNFLYKKLGYFRATIHPLYQDMFAVKALHQIEEFNFYRVAYISSANKFIIPSAKKNETKLEVLMNKLSLMIKVFKRKRNKKENDNKNILELLNEISYLFKSSEYQHEHEIRMILKGINFNRHIKIPPKVYIELVEINSLIEKITLGPKVDRAEEWAATFFYKLNIDGLQPNIIVSHIPFK